MKPTTVSSRLHQFIAETMAATTGVRGALAVTTVVLACVQPAAAQTRELPGNVGQGSNALRMENEYRLKVPQYLVPAVWKHLQSSYGGPVAVIPDEHRHRFKSVVSIEYFTDVYFDTPGLVLLGRKSSVRHRTREVPGDPKSRKDGRELVQIKLNDVNGNDLTRGEIKFSVKHYPSVESLQDKHPVVGLVERDQRAEFMTRIREAGIDPLSLRHILTLKQQRSRIYLSDDRGPFVTVTLDETTSKRLGVKYAFSELELELNEIRYTNATAAERAEMQHYTEALLADLMRAFPAMVYDLTPKYNKMYEGLSGSLPGAALILRIAALDRSMLSALAGLAALALWIVVGLARRRRRAARRSRDLTMTSPHTVAMKQ